VTGKVKSSMSAKITSDSCCRDIGGSFMALGGATRLCVVTVTFPVPGAVTALAGPTQLPWGIDPEHAMVT
jgi:hypothetical protein